MAPSALALQKEFDATSLYVKKDLGKSFAVTELDHYASNNQSKALIGEALEKRIQSIDPDTCDAGEEDSFFVADLGEVYRQHLRWKRTLPRVKPHYGEFPR